MAGIYLHIPFCKQACHYCDFHFSTNTSTRNELVQCMAEEIALQQNYLAGEAIETIYFGGGTPSLLSKDELHLLLSTIQKYFLVEENAEVTLEANPDDLSLEKLMELKGLGINRLSIGIQSFHNNVLTFLNRAHDSRLAEESVLLARQAGFSNISIDLIYAIPGQTDQEWRENIRKAIELQPEHISSYSLTIEDKTVFGRWAAAGKFKPSEDDIAATQLEILVEELESAGYHQYEVSNFSKPDLESRHNSSYWKQQKYLGIGPSAHSYNFETRQYNISNNHLYVRAIREGKIPFEKEMLTRQDHVNEYLLTTLRTSWGADIERMKKLFNYDVLKSNREFIDTLAEQNLIVVEKGFLKLTRAGKLLADKISSELFLVS